MTGRTTSKPWEILRLGRPGPLLLLVLLVSVAGCSLPGEAAAGRSAEVAQIDPGQSKQRVTAGSSATFHLHFDRVQTCSVQVARVKKSLDSSLYSSFDVVVRTSRRSRPGSYPVLVSCGSGEAQRYEVIVKRGRRPPGSRPAMRLIVRSRGAPLPASIDAVAEAHARWLREGAAILDGMRSGQCTDWASQKRPDVVQRVSEAQWAAELQHQVPPPWLGAAQEWPVAAAAVGFTISDSPKPGALVVWREGLEGAVADSGHIGYVESVSPDGLTFSTSEMNMGAPHQMGYRTISTAPVSGRQFILP